MRQLLFLYLRFISLIRKLSLKLRGKTEADIHASRIVSGKAWEEFCDQLKLAGNVLKHPGAPQDAFNQAEGVRYLSRLTRAGLQAYLEYADPSFPVLRRMVDETIKMGADNPDNYYFNAPISGAYEYRITGRRNTINYIGFFTQNGNYGTTGGLAPCGVLEGKDLKIRPDGTFEIILSKMPRGDNWLEITEDSSLLIVRQTFLIREEEIPAELSISNLNGKQKPDPITPAMMDEGLKTASLFVAGAPLLFARWARGFQKHTNTLPQFDPGVSNAAGGDANIIYYHSHWKLAEDEALEIRVTPPVCENWNFQLNNYWMESLDYRYHTICTNMGAAHTEANGSLRIIVAHNDPGVPNWLETCGHDEGTMCWRWYRLAESEKPVQPVCRVIHLSEI